MRLGDTPVPIPNTMVKTQTADGTILETVWESRRLPGPFLSDKSVSKQRQMRDYMQIWICFRDDKRYRDAVRKYGIEMTLSTTKAYDAKSCVDLYE